MLQKYVESIQKYKVPFIVMLKIIPWIIIVFRGKLGTSYFSYRFLCIVPPTLREITSVKCSEISNIVMPSHLKSLFQILQIRIDLDAGLGIKDWEDSIRFALLRCDESLMQSQDLLIQTSLISETLRVFFHTKVHESFEPSPFVESPQLMNELLEFECLKILQSRRETFYKDFNQADENSILPENNPHKILVLTDTNFDFMHNILEIWENEKNVELKCRDLSSENVDSSWWSLRNTINDRLIGESPQPPHFLEEDLLWADVIFVEWSQLLAARLSNVKLSARLIIRLHRFEAFTPSPTLTNWQNVDSLIIVSPWVQKILERSIPGIENNTNIEVVQNVVNLNAYSQEKSSEANRTLALIQYSSIVKDPQWALDVLEILLKQDSSWKLKLVGSSFTESMYSHDYFVEFWNRVKLLGASVQVLGYQEDLHEVLKDVGFILSSSLFESYQISVMQGIASGAFPIIRNWPQVKKIKGAESIYPAKWIVDTPEEAANRIDEVANNFSEVVPDINAVKWALDKNNVCRVLAQLDDVVLKV